MDESMQQFADLARGYDKFTVHGPFRMSIEQALNKSAVQSAIQKAREYLPFFSKDMQREAMEQRLKIVDCMSPVQKLLPLSMTADSKRKLAVDAGVTVTDVNKMLKEFVHARAIHQWIRMRDRLGKPLPTNNQELQQLVALQPSSRTYMMQMEINQKERLGRVGRKRRRYVCGKQVAFRRGDYYLD